jgi:cell division protein ZapE
MTFNEAVNRLDMIYQELTAKPADVDQSRLRRHLGGCSVKKRHRLTRRCAACICGAAWGAENLADGPVLPEPAGRRKQRLHFHRFMLRVHEELTALQGKSDPLEIVADRRRKRRALFR